MCGIAGVAERNDVPAGTLANAATLARLADALAHRGPDGQGESLVGRVGLAHRRLAFIDVAGGQQPLFAGPAALIANGEIYNDLALRAAMREVSFATSSDCEPPLHLWLRNSVSYASQLRGMYAIAIHERGADTLTLSRDPFGIKPLYITERADGIAFASEPQALLAAGLAPRGVRPQARSELLQMQFTTGRETIFPGISRVLPGETLRIAGGRVLARDRQPALPDAERGDISESEALTRLDRALRDSVALHCRSEVPLGIFLSAGIDSSAVLAAMAQQVGGGPVHAFTAAFDVPGSADESAAAATIARSFGAEHEVLRIDAAMVWRDLPRIVASMDDPAADYAIIPSWLLARHARSSVKAVLCGEGGDELFGGYGRYRHAMRPWWRGGRAMRRNGTFDRFDVLREAPTGWRAGFEAAALEAAPGRSRLAAAQAADIADWLPHDLLLKLDRCLMAHGMEGRTPMLDPEVAAAAFNLPDTLKVRDGLGKYLLRRWVGDNAPAARPFAPKQGFTVPIGAWIEAAGARLGPLVAAQPGIAEIAHPDRVRALFNNAGSTRGRHAAWMLLFYALWHRTHVLGEAPDGDVFEALAG